MAAEVTIDELIERSRLESGLRTNAYYDTAQILRYLNAGGAELQDIFTAANQKYIISEFDFTTTGQADAIVELPEDFQQGHSLDIYPDLPGQTRTIRYLSNWLNRNSYGNNVFSLSPAGMDPVYTFLGGNLRFYPPQCTPAAPFRLYYTPLWKDLAVPIGNEFALVGANDTPLVPAPGSFPTATGAWVVTDAGFTTALPTDGSVDLVLTFEAPNGAFSGSYPIVGVSGPDLPITSTFDEAGVTGLLSAAGFTGPAAGTGSYTYQPAGTRATLPAMYGPWSEYLVVYAAIAINTDRQRGTADLERKLGALKVRIASILGNRQEEPQQPPLTRGLGGWGGWDGGGGGWW